MALAVFYLKSDFINYLYKYCNFTIEVFSNADCNPTYMGD